MCTASLGQPSCIPDEPPKTEFYCVVLWLGRIRDLGDVLFDKRLHTHTAESRRLAAVSTRYRVPVAYLIGIRTLSGGVVIHTSCSRLNKKGSNLTKQ